MGLNCVGLIEIKVKLTAILILTFSEICMKNCPRILVKPTQLSFLSIFSKIHLLWNRDNFLYHSIQLNSTDSNLLYSATKIYRGTSWFFGNQSTGSIDVFVANQHSVVAKAVDTSSDDRGFESRQGHFFSRKLILGR